MDQYAHPEVLVETVWVEENLNDASIKLVEIDVDTSAYDSGHIPGALGFNWQTQLQDQVARDILSRDEFETLMRSFGINNEDTVVVFGDNNNWFAAYGFWLFKLYGHDDVRLMNGGRRKWTDENRRTTTAVPEFTPSRYEATEADLTLRAHLPDILNIARAGRVNLVDVRSPDEFTGKIIAPPGMTETAQRGGHIPGATSVPWVTAVADDGTFKSIDELRHIYIESKGVNPDDPTVAYCRIGERSSHTWFTLKYLLGLKDVKNYDGSWTEYGNVVGAPIAKGD